VAAAPVEVELSPVEVPEAEVRVEEPVEEESVLSVEVPVEVAVEDLDRVEVTRLLLALPEEDPVAEPEGTEPEPVALPLELVAVELPTSPGYPEAPEGSEVRPAGILAAGSWEVATAGWLVIATGWPVTTPSALVWVKY
jgi:hypothetical protein